MSETLDELSRILEQIEEMHGTIQDLNDHRYVRQLHAKARVCIETLRKELEETHELAQRLIDSRMAGY